MSDFLNRPVLDRTKAMAQELPADQPLSVIQICQQPDIIKSTL